MSSPPGKVEAVEEDDTAVLHLGPPPGVFTTPSFPCRNGRGIVSKARVIAHPQPLPPAPRPSPCAMSCQCVHFPQGSVPACHQTAGLRWRTAGPPRRSPAPSTPHAAASRPRAEPAPLRVPSMFPAGCSLFNPRMPVDRTAREPATHDRVHKSALCTARGCSGPLPGRFGLTPVPWFLLTYCVPNGPLMMFKSAA